VRLSVVLVPAVLGLLIALYVGRPSAFFLAGAAMLTAVLVVCDGWIIARHDWIGGGLALISHVALLTFAHGYAASPFPAPAALSGALPPASPPATMAIYALPTGVNHRTAAFACRGGSPFEPRDSVSTAVLITHPQGDVLIDTGIGRTISSQMKEFPFLFRLGTELIQLRPAADQLDAAGLATIPAISGPSWLADTSCQFSYPRNSENDKPPGTLTAYLSCAEIAAPEMASTAAMIPMVDVRLCFTWVLRCRIPEWWDLTSSGTDGRCDPSLSPPHGTSVRNPMGWDRP
jgi:hypothetical protein